MIDGVAAMSRFLSLLGSEPEVAKVPFMIDSSKWEVIEAGLRRLQGKGIVNSISLKEGEEKFREHARTVLAFGAAVVVMAFDEQGQAATLRRQDPDLRARLPDPGRRGRLPARGHHLRSRTSSPSPPGIEEHNNYAVDFIEATRWIKAQPAARQGERRRVEHLLQLPRQQPGARGDARRVPLPRHPGRDGHGDRQRRHAGGLRGDRARAARADRGRPAQPAPRRHRAAGRFGRAPQGRGGRPGGGGAESWPRTRGATPASKSACRTRWSRGSTRSSRRTPRRRGRSWAGRSR